MKLQHRSHFIWKSLHDLPGKPRLCRVVEEKHKVCFLCYLAVIRIGCNKASWILPIIMVTQLNFKLGTSGSYRWLTKEASFRVQGLEQLGGLPLTSQHFFLINETPLISIVRLLSTDACPNNFWTGVPIFILQSPLFTFCSTQKHQDAFSGLADHCPPQLLPFLFFTSVYPLCSQSLFSACNSVIHLSPQGRAPDSIA